eukprot:m51a1_g13026 hypothetical protein (175) ;mRNA; r:2021-2654
MWASAKWSGLCEADALAVSAFASVCFTADGRDLADALFRRDGGQVRRWRGYLWFLFRALAKLPDFAGVVYVGCTRRDLSRYAHGGSVRLSGMLCATLVPELAMEESGPEGVVLRLAVSHAKNVSPFAEQAPAGLVVVSPNALLRVDGVRAAACGCCVVEATELAANWPLEGSQF